MDFYLNVYSDGSSASFPTNRAGNFKALLTKEIDLNNIEYSAAVSSVSRYYETFENDVVFLREKRDVPVTVLPLTVHNTYPTTLEVDKIKQKYDDFIKNGDPVYFITSATEKMGVELNVAGKKKTFEIYSGTIYKSTLSRTVSYRSPWFEDVRFELGNMMDVGIVSFYYRPKKDPRSVILTFPSVTQQKLGIVQPSFSCTLTQAKKTEIIELRDKSWKLNFVDLRTTLPYYIQFSPEGVVGGANYQSILKLFPKVGSALDDYLESHFLVMQRALVYLMM